MDGPASRPTDPLQQPRCNAVYLDWKNITYAVPAKKKEKRALISHMYGKAEPGTLTAIMGPSGAGKTTLMNVLSGHYDKGYEGEVQVNGWVRDTELFNQQSCYVMQDDCLLPELTVREALTMSLQLRMPSLNRSKREQLVGEAITRWGLDACQNTRTSSLSGGQRKRLAISQELISNPPVIFLDEPTSGLDSISALRCVLVMRSLAAAGHTVLCSIHNPSAKLFSHFDRLYMISEGLCIYNGPVDKLLHFLSAQNLHCPLYHNPADFITEIASGEYGNLNRQLAKSFTPDSSEECNKKTLDHPVLTAYGGKIMNKKEKAEECELHKVRVDSFHQFLILVKRCFFCVIRNKVATQLRVVSYVSFAIMLTMLYYDVGNNATRVISNAALFLLCLTIALFQSAMPTVLIFPTEMSVLLREHRNCWYSPSMYYIARIMTEMPFTICGPLIMMVALYWSTSQPPDLWRAATVILFTIQVGSVSQGLALMVSAASSIQTSVFLVLPAASPSFLFSGFFVQQTHIHIAFRWIMYTSHLYHGLQGILEALYGHGRPELECEDGELCFLSDPKEVLRSLGVEDIRLYLRFFILLGMDLLFRLTAFLILKWRLRRKR
ncbi:ATP-binding cassette sub-family G member 1 isoform X2 [Ixodes scapularis]|nr:ATP-binding cassette sub-family G member 1 isoform X2 [Ixodes scapularis]XP_040074396.1 ATP-binding cassette sub-family G member 1 isoform X2 [Ixodes scapularis]